MAPEATLPRGDVNVPGDYFSLAGFEVIMDGRVWVLTEVLVNGIALSPLMFDQWAFPPTYGPREMAFEFSTDEHRKISGEMVGG